MVRSGFTVVKAAGPNWARAEVAAQRPDSATAMGARGRVMAAPFRGGGRSRPPPRAHRETEPSPPGATRGPPLLRLGKPMSSGAKARLLRSLDPAGADRAGCGAPA